MANAKVARASLITLLSAVGLVYGAIGEVQSYSTPNFLFGLIIISVFGLFLGLGLLRHNTKF